MKKILFVYSSTDGHTQKICEHMVKSIPETIQLQMTNLSENPNIKDFDLIVIGASIRYGKHNPEVTSFLNVLQQTNPQIPTAFFSVNVVARKASKNQPDTNPYMIKFLKGLDTLPTELAVFAGALDYTKLGWLDRTMIQFIMWMTKGPTAKDTRVDYTEWYAVQNFAKGLVSEFM